MRFVSGDQMRIHILVSIVSLGLSSSLWSQDPIPDGPWKMPKDWVKLAVPKDPTPEQEKKYVEEQQKAFYDFMWRSFIALNWPNEQIKVDAKNGINKDGTIKPGFGVRGKPDFKATLDQLPQRTTVWEYYKEPGEVFPDPNVWNLPQYSQWNTVRPLPPRPQAVNNQKTLPARRMLDFETLTEYTSGTTQPYFFAMRTGPLYDRNGNLVRYEVAVNRSFFKYIREFEYFNAKKQAEAVKVYITDASKRNTPQAFQRPPHGNESYLSKLPDYDKVGLIDVKAAWRVITKEDEKKGYDKRYLCRNLFFWEDANGKKKDSKKYVHKSQKMGLVALHVLRWTPQGYVASTFEQVDNVSSNDGVPASFNDGSTPSPEELEFGFAG